jgi:ELWxxDGT repeat protein
MAPGTVGSLVSEGTPMVVFRGELWLVANDGVHGAELWHTNGTTAGTKLALDVDPGPHSSDPYGLVVNGKSLLFGARDRNHGYELWVTDGSPNGTRLVRDIYAGGGSSYPTTWAGLPMTQGRVVVLADDGHHGYEPWVSNGTKKGTRLLRDVTPGSGGSYWYSAASLGTRVLFSMIDGNVWVSDGKHGPGHTDKLANF